VAGVCVCACVWAVYVTKAAGKVVEVVCGACGQVGLCVV